MSSYLCERCAETFTERADYTAHKKAHMRGEIPDKSVEELMGAEPTEVTEPIVAEPIVDISPKNLKAKPGEVIEQQTRPYDKPQVLNLTYHYEGNCRICGGKVETLMLDDVIEKNDKRIKNKQVVVAWCGRCKKQLRQRQVAKL